MFPHDDRAIVEAVQSIAEARGIPLAQIALAWVLKNTAVTALIVGATMPHHLVDAVAALAVQMSDDEIERLEEGYTPRWQQGILSPLSVATMT
jgi:aryl-alcohol dehydrogenase-like predicted oxidoreductase